MSVILQNVRGQVRKSSFARSVAQQSTSKSEPPKEIKIPNRIHRGPTDILKALASTVGSDPTGTHYKYHDDPFLIPAAHLFKRSYALSKESGRKAAQWIRQEHADLFQHKVAVPFIDVFAPPAVYNEESDVTEEELKRLIKMSSVTDAMFVYELLQKKNIDVSHETKQNLLELVCFYNGKDALSEDLLEEKWYTSPKQEMARKTWADGGFADKLFQSLEVQDSKAYCALIQGMTKYKQIDQAMHLYQEMLTKNLPICTETFNSLIRVSDFVKESYEMRWQHIWSLLNEMKQQQCIPNLGTLNAVLAALTRMATMKNATQQALRTITEFRNLGIQPSLASFHHLIKIAYWRDGATPPLLSQILSYLEKRPNLTARDPEDVEFFVKAMNIIANKLEDVELAYRLNTILHTNNNYDLIGDGLRESIYYRYFFQLVCNNEPIEEVMKLYTALVPRIYSPEMNILSLIISTIDMNGSKEYLPQLWSDLVLLEFSNKEELLNQFLDTMYKNSTKEAPLCDQLADIAWAIWTEIENQPERRRIKIMWSGLMIGSVLQSLLNAKRIGDAYKVFNRLRKGTFEIVGVPEIHTLQDFLDATIDNDDVNGALVCVGYCNENGFPEAYDMCKKLEKSLVLNETQKLDLKKLLETCRPREIKKSPKGEDVKPKQNIDAEE